MSPSAASVAGHGSPIATLAHGSTLAPPVSSTDTFTETRWISALLLAMALGGRDAAAVGLAGARTVTPMRTPKATRATPVTATATGRNGMRVVAGGAATGPRRAHDGDDTLRPVAAVRAEVVRGGELTAAGRALGRDGGRGHRLAGSHGRRRCGHDWRAGGGSGGRHGRGRLGRRGGNRRRRGDWLGRSAPRPAQARATPQRPAAARTPPARALARLGVREQPPVRGRQPGQARWSTSGPARSGEMPAPAWRPRVSPAGARSAGPRAPPPVQQRPRPDAGASRGSCSTGAHPER